MSTVVTAPPIRIQPPRRRARAATSPFAGLRDALPPALQPERAHSPRDPRPAAHPDPVRGRDRARARQGDDERRPDRLPELRRGRHDRPARAAQLRARRHRDDRRPRERRPARPARPRPIPRSLMVFGNLSVSVVVSSFQVAALIVVAVLRGATFATGVSGIAWMVAATLGFAVAMHSFAEILAGAHPQAGGVRRRRAGRPRSCRGSSPAASSRSARCPPASPRSPRSCRSPTRSR